MNIQKHVLIFFVFFLVLFVASHEAIAHPYSVSYTTVTFSDEETSLIFSIDTLSVMELIKLEDRVEVQNEAFLLLHEDQIVELIENHLMFFADDERQLAIFDQMQLEEKNGTQFITVSFQYPMLTPGVKIQLRDNFYLNDPTTNYINLISVVDHGIWSEMIFQGNNREWIYLLTGDQSEQVEQSGMVLEQQRSSWFDFFTLGVEHILSGYDHLLFLLVLMLRKQKFSQYVAIITSFTIAHSITIAMTALGYITLPSRIVESVIALSICYVALENIFRHNLQQRWLVTFLFGLIHGMGFASILKEMTIAKEQIIIPLLSFNIGIEVIQLTLVAILLPLLNWMQNLKISRRIVVTSSSAVALIGCIWLIERLWQ